MKKIYFLLFLIAFTFQLPSSVNAQEKKFFTRKQAMVIAEQAPEVKAFYDLNNQRFVNCIEVKVERPCDSNWVTCIENAWVVSFTLGDVCGVKHDGRLSVTLVIDSERGKIISRFPEVDYFQNKFFCRDNRDCLSASQKNNSEPCLNFIYGQVIPGDYQLSGECACVESVCAVGGVTERINKSVI